MNILKRIESLRAVRAKATQGEWNMKMCFPSSVEDIVLCDTAANEWLTLLDNLETAVITLEVIVENGNIAKPTADTIVAQLALDKINFPTPKKETE